MPDYDKGQETPKTCPKCKEKSYGNRDDMFLCDSIVLVSGGVEEGEKCLRRQLAQRDEKLVDANEALRENMEHARKMEAVRDSAYVWIRAAIKSLPVYSPLKDGPIVWAAQEAILDMSDPTPQDIEKTKKLFPGETEINKDPLP